MSKKTDRIAVYGLCIALAFILSYLESLIPVFFVPGMKIGLTNLVVLIALYYLGGKAAFVINCVRIILVAFTFGNLQSLCYSAAGGLLSYLVMLGLKQTKKFAMVTVSVAGSVFHNVGQIVVAMLMVESTSVVWYFAVLTISGVISGGIVGILGGMVLSRLPKDFRKD